MSQKEETRFKTKVLRDLKFFKTAYYIKTQEHARRGVPDIMGCIDGRFFALELKRDKGRLDDLQANRLAKIRAAGGFALSVSPACWETEFRLMKECFTP